MKTQLDHTFSITLEESPYVKFSYTRTLHCACGFRHTELLEPIESVYERHLRLVVFILLGMDIGERNSK